MSQFRCGGHGPMYGLVFRRKAEAGAVYQHVVPDVDPEGDEPEGRVGGSAAIVGVQNLAKEDAADDLLFNEVIWRAVRGAELADAGPRCERRLLIPHPGE